MRKLLLSTAEAAPIADAFEQVLTAQEHRGKWITASNFGRILNYELDLSLPASLISSEALVSALSRDIRFKTASLEFDNTTEHQLLQRPFIATLQSMIMGQQFSL